MWLLFLTLWKSGSKILKVHLGFGEKKSSALKKKGIRERKNRVVNYHELIETLEYIT